MSVFYQTSQVISSTWAVNAYTVVIFPVLALHRRYRLRLWSLISVSRSHLQRWCRSVRQSALTESTMTRRYVTILNRRFAMHAYAVVYFSFAMCSAIARHAAFVVLRIVLDRFICRASFLYLCSALDTIMFSFCGDLKKIIPKKFESNDSYHHAQHIPRSVARAQIPIWKNKNERDSAVRIYKVCSGIMPPQMRLIASAVSAIVSSWVWICVCVRAFVCMYEWGAHKHRFNHWTSFSA